MEFFTVRRSLATIVATAILAGTGGIEAGDQRYYLALDGDDYPITGDPGAPFSAELVCHLVTRIDPEVGIEAWSLGVVAEGGDITGITVAGTLGADVGDDPPGLRDGGFERSELTVDGVGECAGRAGAVSTVVLSWNQPVTLALDVRSQPIARLSVEGVFPGPGERGDLRFSFVEGCQGSDDPVTNEITVGGESIVPETYGGYGYELRGRAPCPQPDAPLQVILQRRNIGQAPELFAGGVPTADPNRPASVTLSAGETQIWAGIVSQLASEGDAGAKGWSLAIGVTGDITLVDATTDGTVAGEIDDGPPGIRTGRFGGFEKTEVVDPEIGSSRPQGQGCVSAVVLSFTQPTTLEVEGTATVLAMTFDGENGATGQIGWQDGIRGSGGPVETGMTVRGEYRQPSCLQWADVTVRERFRRGDANDDGRIDLSDPVTILGCKFLGEPCPGCRDAMDANDDGMVNVSDPIALLSHLFLGAPPPPAPGPTVCGDDPTPDELPECRYHGCF